MPSREPFIFTEAPVIDEVFDMEKAHLFDPETEQVLAGSGG